MNFTKLWRETFEGRSWEMQNWKFYIIIARQIKFHKFVHEIGRVQDDSEQTDTFCTLAILFINFYEKKWMVPLNLHTMDRYILNVIIYFFPFQTYLVNNTTTNEQPKNLLFLLFLYANI